MWSGVIMKEPDISHYWTFCTVQHWWTDCISAFPNEPTLITDHELLLIQVRVFAWGCAVVPLYVHLFFCISHLSTDSIFSSAITTLFSQSKWHFLNCSVIHGQSWFVYVRPIFSICRLYWFPPSDAELGMDRLQHKPYICSLLMCEGQPLIDWSW